MKTYEEIKNNKRIFSISNLGGLNTAYVELTDSGTCSVVGKIKKKGIKEMAGKREIKCWALQIAPTLTMDKMMDTAEKASMLDGFIGYHPAPTGDAILLYDSIANRNKAYTQLNSGAEKEEDVRVAIIIPPAFIPAEYVMRKN